MDAVVIDQDAEVDYTRLTQPDPPATGDAGGWRVDRRWAAEGTAGILQRVRRDVYATAWRCRRQLLPHSAAGVTLGAGLAAEAIASSGAMPPSLTALVLAAGAFPTVAAVSQRVRRRRSRWARRTLLGGLFGASWLTLSPFGVTVEHAAVLLGVEYALAARWWQANRPGHPDPAAVKSAGAGGDAPADAADDDDTDEQRRRADRIAADWDTYVACEGGPVVRSALRNPESTGHTVAFDLQLWRGRHTIATVRDALGKVATGLDVATEDLIIEPHPDRSAAWCRFQVVTDSPISGDVLFDRPRRRGGILDIGPYADGSGEAPWRLYTEDSMWGGVIIGRQGSGKSRVAENLAVSALSGGDTVVWYLDPQHGASSPGLARVADWCVALEGAEAMLAAALAIGDARSRENSTEGWQGFTPSPQRPGLLIIVEECHRPFGDNQAATRWAYVARECRKVGIAVIALSQYVGLDTFGGSEPLRGAVMAGNALCMKVNSNNGKQLMAGLTVDPLHLPDIPGYAYTVGSDETGIRTAPFRNRLIVKGDAEAWLRGQTQPALDVLSQTATLIAGTAYRDRHVVSDTGNSRERAWVDALRDGTVPADLDPQEIPQGKTSAGEMGIVIEFPAALTTEDLTRPAPPLELTDSHRAVLAAVASGADRPKDIEDTVGLSHRRVAALLRELVEAGHLTQPRYGRYQRAA